MKPKVSETYSGNTTIERAEAANELYYLRAEGIVSPELSKEETIAYLNEFARMEGLSNAVVTFESTLTGNMGQLVGFKNMDTLSGNKSVKHIIKLYSKENSCIVLTAMLLASDYPKEVQSFFNSINYN